MKTHNIYDYVLNLFKAKETLRVSLNEIFPNKDFYCASDAHILGVTAKENCGGIYQGAEKHPTSAIDLILNHESNEVIHVDRIEFMENFNLVVHQWDAEKLPCEKCSGQGSITCGCCENESDCKKCDGTGDSETIKPFSEMKLVGDDIMFFGTRFSSHYLNIVLMCSYFLESDTITIRYNKHASNKPFIFEINDLKILIMPIYR